MPVKEQLKAILVRIHENGQTNLYSRFNHKLIYIIKWTEIKFICLLKVNHYLTIQKHRIIFNKFNGDIDGNYQRISSNHETYQLHSSQYQLLSTFMTYLVSLK